MFSVLLSSLGTSRAICDVTSTNLQIIDLVDKVPPRKKKDIASEMGIPASTLSTILKNRRDALQASHVFGSSKKKRNRDSSRPDVDAALFQWFTAARAQSVPISSEILKTKAEKLAVELDSSSLWTCSSGRLSRWKNSLTLHTKLFQVRM